MWVLKTLRVLFMHSVCSHKSFFPWYTSTRSPTIGYNLSWLMKGRTAFPAPCLPCNEKKNVIPDLTQLLPHPYIGKSLLSLALFHPGWTVDSQGQLGLDLVYGKKRT